MPLLKSPHDFNRPIDPGGFCYICGGLLADGEVDDDHVVNKKLFRPEDRSTLLILRAHKACNQAKSMSDQEISQMVGLLWRSPAEIQQNMSRISKKASLHEVEGEGPPIGALASVPLRRMIFRWVQGFHAALYSDCLLDQPANRFRVQEPVPAGNEILQADPVALWEALFVGTIDRNRAVGQYDGVEHPSGALRYTCVWTKSDDGLDLCIFRLDIYEWSKLGAPQFGERVCVGCYTHSRPWTATLAADTSTPESRAIQ